MKALLKAGTLALVIASLSLVSCGKEDIAAESITIEKELEMYVDSTYQMTATIVPDNATGTVNWTINDTAVAKISESGLLTAYKKGSAIVTANVGNAIAVCNLTVLNNPVTLEMSLYEVQQKKCTVTVKPSDEEGYYYCGYALPSEVGKMSDKEITDGSMAYLDQMVQMYKQYGYDITIKDLLQQGTKNLIASGLTANTEYQMYSFGVDVDSKRASKTVTRLNVKTKEVVPSSMTFKLEFDSLAKVRKITKGDTTYTYNGYFKCTPSNDKETYALNGTTAMNLDTAFHNSPLEFFTYVEAYYDSYYSSYGGFEGTQVKAGTRDVYFSSMVHKEKYVVIAIGYEGGFTTKGTTFEYTFIHPDSVPQTAPMFRKPANMNNIVPADEIFVPDRPFIFVPGMCH